MYLSREEDGKGAIDSWFMRTKYHDIKSFVGSLMNLLSSKTLMVAYSQMLSKEFITEVVSYFGLHNHVSECARMYVCVCLDIDLKEEKKKSKETSVVYVVSVNVL